MRKTENNRVTIHKIHNKFTSDDCVQIMLSYSNNLTIIDNNGVMFHATDLDDINTNKYLTDERRKQFPFSDIPTHYEKNLFLFAKRFFINQLFNYNQPYVVIHDGVPEKIMFSKIENESFFIQNIPQISKPEVIIKSDTSSILKELANKNSFIINYNGGFVNIWTTKEERDSDRLKFITYLVKNNIDFNIRDDDLISILSPIRISAMPSSLVPQNSQKCIITPNNNDFDIKIVITEEIKDDMVSAKIYNLTYNIEEELKKLYELRNEIKYLKEPKIKKKLLKK